MIEVAITPETFTFQDGLHAFRCPGPENWAKCQTGPPEG